MTSSQSTFHTSNTINEIRIYSFTDTNVCCGWNQDPGLDPFFRQTWIQIMFLNDIHLELYLLSNVHQMSNAESRSIISEAFLLLQSLKVFL